MISRDLVIIEAPGKIRTLSRIFQAVGLHADVFATLGHFLEYPKSLSVSAIQRQGELLVEAQRIPHRAEVFGALKRTLGSCKGRLLIATDDDQEGHSIAWDVATLAESMGLRLPTFRFLISGLDADSVIRGLNRLVPIDEKYKVPGTARRMTDRLIGEFYSDIPKGLPVGRVQSALLGLCDTGNVIIGEVAVQIPAADGGASFTGVVPVMTGRTPAEVLEAMDLQSIGKVSVGQRVQEPLGRPMDFSDALLSLNSALGIKIDAAAALLQEMYEKGEISYPRTPNRGFTGAGADVVAQLARVKGIIAFKKDVLPRVPDTQFAGHEAIRILQPDVAARIEVAKPVRLQPSIRDAALALIARSTLEAGVSVIRETADVESLPGWAQGISWKRDVRRVAMPWRVSDVPAERTFDLETALVKAMVANGVGRPATWAGHAAKFLDRGYVDGELRLTDKGKRVLEQAPAALRDVVTSREIEGLLESGVDDVADLVREALTAVENGDANAVERLVSSLQERGEEEAYENRPRPRF
ncbi:DNA topoisomerase [Burkholderia contaminans]|uniref:Type IA DNA topoisomerase n=1 Tax=Burkholderia contaminans TaxID=488447 RepID=A0A2S5DM71_9BURK|nr:DNA topoisomerase [Burkholderia contaminans]POZ80195.1 type IA DNA topoisomerase [Burkholderia contaminans]